MAAQAVTQPWRRAGRWLARGVALMVLIGVLGITALIGVIVRYGRNDRAAPADVIVILGGGLEPTERRTLHAVALYQRGYAPRLLCTGGVAVTAEQSEAAWCRQVALGQGVPATAIVLENGSFNTEQNAIRAAAVMRARGWRDAVLVTDDYHLWRAALMFQAQHITVYPSPAQATMPGIPALEKALALGREVAALGWYVGQSLAG